jgi:hypothetical protein
MGGVQLGILIAFTVLTETVFQWQGMGFIFLEAVERGDTSLAGGVSGVCGRGFRGGEHYCGSDLRAGQSDGANHGQEIT